MKITVRDAADWTTRLRNANRVVYGGSRVNVNTISSEDYSSAVAQWTTTIDTVMFIMCTLKVNVLATKITVRDDTDWTIRIRAANWVVEVKLKNQHWRTSIHTIMLEVYVYELLSS